MQGKDTNNPLADLCEANARIQAQPNGNFDLLLELRFGEGEIEIEDSDVHYVVRLTGARLVVSLEGLEITPGSKYAEDVRAGAVVRTRNEVTEKKFDYEAEAKAMAKIKLAPEGMLPEVGGGGTAKVAGSKSVATSLTTEEYVGPVVARGGDTWEVRLTNDEKHITGKYLNDQSLCLLEQILGSNRTEVKCHVVAKKRQLDFDLVATSAKSWAHALTINKKAIIETLLARYLTIDGAAFSSPGSILLSQVRLFDAD